MPGQENITHMWSPIGLFYAGFMNTVISEFVCASSNNAPQQATKLKKRLRQANLVTMCKGRSYYLRRKKIRYFLSGF